MWINPLQTLPQGLVYFSFIFLLGTFDVDPELDNREKFIFEMDRRTDRRKVQLLSCAFTAKNSLTFLQDKVYNKYLGDRRTGSIQDLELGALPTTRSPSEHSGKDK